MAEIYYSVSPEIHRMARIEHGEVVELDFEIPNKPISLLNSIFLGRVIEIQKPLQAAFVDIGLSKPGIVPIQEGSLTLLKQGDIVLVQVTRTENPLEDKGTRLTRLITLSLGPLLYTPFKTGLNFSKRLKNTDTFKDKIQLNEGEGLIIRHCATLDDPLLEMLEQLRQEWQDIQSQLQVKPPILLGNHFNLLTRILRSLSEVDKLIIDDRILIKQSKERALYSSENAFDERCEEAWESLSSPKINLTQGGNLYIEETHALVVIDVNSQGALRHALPFNRKVVKEILHQIRLRDLGGKIIVDLVHPPKSWKSLFTDQDLSSDIQIWGISSLGLLEMIRQKKRLSVPQRLKLQFN